MRIKPFNSPYHKDIGDKQHFLSDQEEEKLLKTYTKLRREIYYLILECDSAIEHILDIYADLLVKGKSIAKLTKGFNAKKNTNNKRLADNLTNALNSANPKEKLKNIEFSDDVIFSILTHIVSNGKPKNLTLINNKRKRMYAIESKLVNSALMAAYNIANKYSNDTFGFDIKDAVQEANMGLLEAVKKYDIEYKTKDNQRVKFITYAYYIVENRVKDWIMKNSRLIRLPRSKLDKIFLVIEALNNVGAESGIKEITEKANLILKTRRNRPLTSNEMITQEQVVKSIELLNNNTLNLDRPPVHRSKPLGEMISDKASTPEENAIHNSNLESIYNVLKSVLTNVEFTIVSQRVMGYTLQEVADTLKLHKKTLSKERVRQIEARALEKLKGTPQLEKFLGEFYGT